MSSEHTLKSLVQVLVTLSQDCALRIRQLEEGYLYRAGILALPAADTVGSHVQQRARAKSHNRESGFSSAWHHLTVCEAP